MSGGRSSFILTLSLLGPWLSWQRFGSALHAVDNPPTYSPQASIKTRVCGEDDPDKGTGPIHSTLLRSPSRDLYNDGSRRPERLARFLFKVGGPSVVALFTVHCKGQGVVRTSYFWLLMLLLSRHRPHVLFLVGRR